MASPTRRVLLAVSLLACALPANALATRGLELGFADPLFGSADPELRSEWLGRAVEVGAGTARLSAGWGFVRREPDNPRDPADPAYDFRFLDAAVHDAEAHGLDVLLTVSGAPTWAEGPNRPASATRGSWKPQPAALREYMVAVATRYSGSFGGLPRVRDYQIWNEPNLEIYLAPQYIGQKPFASGHYKRMLNAAHGGVKSVRPQNRVITAGTAPYGEKPGRDRTHPLAFWRDVFCLKGRKALNRKKACSDPAKFDILAHHPINTTGSPTTSASHPDDATGADLGEVRRTLRAAERQSTVAGKTTHEMWATEFWWDSDPPDPERGVPLGVQARYIEETLFLIWKARFSTAVQLLVRDMEVTPATYGDHLGNGLFHFDGRPKPSVRAFRFPFVAERRGSDRVALWGKAPEAGQVVVQRKTGRGWRALAKLRAGNNQIFTGKARLQGRQKLRAVSDGQISLVWRLR